ncbi:MAG: acyl-CoA dehydrogenase family protein [Alphaproteobacteria bacterium]|nr:acyl-CoA dehydrogenase family protein [Alphaproteobacteria bacterium]
MQALSFEPCELGPETDVLRARIRAFIAEHVEGLPPELRAQSWSAADPEFSAKLGAAGFIGMTWPRHYGGHAMSALERYVVLEELLAAGAPVGAHWIADRQSGPLLMRFGTRAQCERVLPPITRGELFCCIGMSEPDTGSDLAGVSARAVRSGDGWCVNGTKLWTSGAQVSHYMIALLRTSTESKHGGLTQFLIDMKTPGITVRPIRDLSGAAHFNEVVFEDVWLPADAIIGKEGEGWNQVTAELAYERSGPERFLSSFRLLVELVRVLGQNPDARAAVAIGRLAAHLITLRRMSLAVAAKLALGEDPALEAAIVKDLGAVFEQEIPEIAAALVPVEPSLDHPRAFERVLAQVIMIAPSFSLRGGTREILRGIIARGLGLR